MVESTKANPNLLVGEYARTGIKPRAGDKDVLLVAQAQSIDAVYPDWVQRSQLNKSEYQPFDSNFPPKIPRREFFKAAYTVDAPLTQFGQHLARVIGRQMVDFSFHPPHIYASPSLKCLETAALIASNYKSKVEINIEPGLWGEYGKIDSGLLISPETAKKQIGFPINREYQPEIPLSLAEKCSDLNDWQRRCIKTFKAILEKEQYHAVFVLDSLGMKILTAYCTYGETFKFNNEADLINTSFIPYGCCLSFERSAQGKFMLPENFFPSYTTSEYSTRFDYDKLDEQLKTK